MNEKTIVRVGMQNHTKNALILYEKLGLWFCFSGIRCLASF